MRNGLGDAEGRKRFTLQLVRKNGKGRRPIDYGATLKGQLRSDPMNLD